MKARFWWALGALTLAALACSLPGATQPDAEATLDAVSTEVKLTLNAPNGLPTARVSTQLPSPTQPPIQANTPTPVQLPTLANPPTPKSSTRPGDIVPAFYRATPPQIDGALTEWSDLSNAIKSPVFKSENWAGIGDQSGVFALTWDEKNLYLAVEVTDDAHVQTQHGELIFQGDSIELLLDADLRGDFSSTVLSPDDYQLGLSPGNLAGGAPEAYLWFPTERTSKLPNLVLVAQPTNFGYQLEAVVPWSLFGLTPQRGQTYGFALSLSDNDTPNTAEQQSMVSSVGTRRLTIPTTWGTLRLDP